MISEELADLWIISTCLANQYSAKLYIDGAIISDDNLERIFIKAGEIAKIVNYYEGPKKLNPGEEIKSIEYMVSNFQSSLFLFAKSKDIDLINFVKDKVKKIAIRDKDRFETSYDPSSSNSVKDFFNIVKNTGCHFACHAKVWGSQIWDTSIKFEENISRMFFPNV